MTSDQRIALSVFVVVVILGGGIFLLMSAGNSGDTADCSSGEVGGVPIREGQTPDAQACEAMAFAVQFSEAPAEDCQDFVSSELANECASKAEIDPTEWTYVGDSGSDPSFPDEICVELAHEDGFRTVSVERNGDVQRIVGSDC
jgi:hypothetical protein